MVFYLFLPRSSSGLGRQILILVTRVRLPYAVHFLFLVLSFVWSFVLLFAHGIFSGNIVIVQNAY